MFKHMKNGPLYSRVIFDLELSNPSYSLNNMNETNETINAINNPNLYHESGNTSQSHQSSPHSPHSSSIPYSIRLHQKQEEKADIKPISITGLNCLALT